MNVIVIGAGALGLGLAEYLERFDHEITLVEADEAVAEAANAKLDAMTVVGSGSDPAALEQAGVRNADMLIAVTPNDDVNLLACHFAMQYNVGKRIARVMSDGILKTPGIDLKLLGVTQVIETENELVNAALSLVELPGLTESADFHDGNIFLRGYRVSEDMPVCGKTLAEVSKMSGTADMLVVAIVRNKTSIIPSGEDTLLPGDDFITIMPKDSYEVYRDLINRPEAKIKKIIVSGDTGMAVNIADAMTENADRVLLLDPNRKHAEDAAEELDNVEVMHADATDTNVLQEMNAAACDFFIAANKDMEDNIMSCILAKAEGASQVIALRNDDRHFDRFLALGIDHVISPKMVTLQKIIESIQIAPIDSLMRLKKEGLSVVRVKVSKRNAAVGKTLSALYKVFKRGIISGAIVRKDQVIIPKGETVLLEGDEVIIICYEHNIPFINRIFRVDLRV